MYFGAYACLCARYACVHPLMSAELGHCTPFSNPNGTCSLAHCYWSTSTLVPSCRTFEPYMETSIPLLKKKGYVGDGQGLTICLESRLAYPLASRASAAGGGGAAAVARVAVCAMRCHTNLWLKILRGVPPARAFRHGWGFVAFRPKFFA